MTAALVLGIETSGRCPSVALQRGGSVVAQRTVTLEGSRRSSALIMEVSDACREAGITPQQIDLVAVGIGPGSFTGLRIGVTFAKTLAYSIDCPVVGVNSLQAVAEGLDSKLGIDAGVERLHVVSDAQRNEVFYQRFARPGTAGDGRQSLPAEPSWVAAGEREILAPPTLATRAHEGDWVVGPAVERYHAEFMSFGVRLILRHCEPGALSVARLGERLQGISQTDSWSLLPDYGRLSSAEEKRGEQLPR